jgi:hypothetical protein
MKKYRRIYSLLILIIILSVGCKDKVRNEDNQKTKKIVDQVLIGNISLLIDSLYTVDQNIQLEHVKALQNGENKKIKKLALQQKSIFKNHIPILKKIYSQIGYPTIKLVGKEKSNKYFTLVQHSDSDVQFQKEMLIEITKEVKKGNVNAKNHAFLTDRVKLAQQKPQVYGTQVYYNTNTGQVFPKLLIDSINVNKRRKEIGIESLEEYLNKNSKWHFKMNKAHYDKLGIKEPILYIID